MPKIFIGAFIMLTLLSFPFESFAEDGFNWQWPVENFVYQRSAANTANVEFRIKCDSKTLKTLDVTLQRGQTIYRTTRVKVHNRIARGVFKDVPSNLYTLKTVAEGKELARNVAVGEVFIVAGQSNAYSATFDHPSPVSRTGKVILNKICSTCKLEPADYAEGKTDWLELKMADDFASLENSVFCMYAGDYLVEHRNVPVCFVNVARGATKSSEWLPGGVQFSRLASALKAIPAAAVLWIQGESDVRNHSEAESRENLRQIILASRRLAPRTPFIVALTSQDTGNDFERNSVRRAQRSVIGEGLALMGPDIDKLRTVEGYFDVSKLDIRADGLVEHGKLWGAYLDGFLTNKRASGTSSAR